MENELNELVEEINAEIVIFNENSAAQLEKGNKSAGQRARKSSLVLGNLLKKFRAVSVKA